MNMECVLSLSNNPSIQLYTIIYMYSKVFHLPTFLFKLVGTYIPLRQKKNDLIMINKYVSVDFYLKLDLPRLCILAYSIAFSNVTLHDKRQF